MSIALLTSSTGAPGCSAALACSAAERAKAATIGSRAVFSYTLDHVANDVFINIGDTVVVFGLDESSTAFYPICEGRVLAVSFTRGVEMSIGFIVTRNAEYTARCYEKIALLDGKYVRNCPADDSRQEAYIPSKIDFFIRSFEVESGGDLDRVRELYEVVTNEENVTLRFFGKEKDFGPFAVFGKEGDKVIVYGDAENPSANGDAVTKWQVVEALEVLKARGANW